MRGRHIRRRLTFPWPEWVAWALVATIWATSASGVYLAITKVAITSVRDGDHVRITVRVGEK